MALEKGKKKNIPPTCREREPSFSKGAAALFLIFSIEEATSSGICSTPTTRPSGPTINAKHAVKYPVPAKEIKHVNSTHIQRKSRVCRENDIFKYENVTKFHLLRVAAPRSQKNKLEEVCLSICLFKQIHLNRSGNPVVGKITSARIS